MSSTEPQDIANQVVILLGADATDEALIRQIGKFIKCNGALGVMKAANIVAARRKTTAEPVVNPWAYCIQVFNGNAARSVVLHQSIYLLENSLRSRIDYLMTSSGGEEWYRDVHTYLTRDIAPVFLSDQQFQDVQDRSGSDDPPYPIQRFKVGSTFCERIPFWGLQAIVTHNYAKGPLYDLFTCPRPSERLDPGLVSSSLDKIRDVRNTVAHHRAISPQLYLKATAICDLFLEHLEFDMYKTEERIGAAVAALFRDRADANMPT